MANSITHSDSIAEAEKISSATEKDGQIIYYKNDTETDEQDYFENEAHLSKELVPTTRKRLFAEKLFPVTEINKQVCYENGGNPFKGLHRWYSRKPLSFSRASVLAAILPADGMNIETFEYLLGLEGKWDQKLYKTPPGTERIKKVQELCKELWGTETPTVLDAFAGGGSIPFEAARYGLNVLASDLNPVAVVTMKAAMEYPLKFGPDLQIDIDKWVKWVGDQAEKRLAEFFPSQPGEIVQNYLWAHTVTCPSCQSTVPLSPNWWVDRSLGAEKKGKWAAVRPIPNPSQKCVDFEMVIGSKGKGTTIKTANGDYDPEATTTFNRGTGKCPNCSSLIENEFVKAQAQAQKMKHQLYAVAAKKNTGELIFRLPVDSDMAAIKNAESFLDTQVNRLQSLGLVPVEPTGDYVGRINAHYYGCEHWYKMFNPRQLLTLVTYVEIINEAKSLIFNEYSQDKAEAILVYLALVMDRCVDKNSRLTMWSPHHPKVDRATMSHSLNLMWNYPDSDPKKLWEFCYGSCIEDYSKLCSLFGTKFGSTGIPGLLKPDPKSIQIDSSSADNLFHIPNGSVHAVITDPPYYSTIQYAELSDFFYVWMKRILGDVLPELFVSELTDKEREAVANPSRFRNMGVSPDALANADYEAKMSMVFAEYFRVLRDDGVMVVQFNHKDSGAWDTLSKSLIDAGFEITASWSVSTENPQNLHQSGKNAVSSTVLLVCRKRDPNADQAWWDDLRPEVGNIVERRAPEFEANGITGIDLYLSCFGPALNVFSRCWPVLDSAGERVQPAQAFAEARRAVAGYRFRKLANSETAGMDSLTQWYLLAWDAFKAREFPFDDARQLALAIGGFDVSDLSRTYKLLDSASGSCKFLTPSQRLKKRAFKTSIEEFSLRHVIDGLHAVMAIYEEDQNLMAVRRFMKETGLTNNEMFMKAFEVALSVLPTSTDEYKILLNLRLGMDEIQAKVLYQQEEIILDLEKEKQQDLCAAMGLSN
jgi:putative DNA methylase